MNFSAKRPSALSAGIALAAILFIASPALAELHLDMVGKAIGDTATGGAMALMTVTIDKDNSQKAAALLIQHGGDQADPYSKPRTIAFDSSKGFDQFRLLWAKALAVPKSAAVDEIGKYVDVDSDNKVSLKIGHTADDAFLFTLSDDSPGFSPFFLSRNSVAEFSADLDKAGAYFGK